MSETTKNLEEKILYLIAAARPEQQQAIRSRKPLVVVSAGAGTGKTHTLAMRFAWLLATDPECGVEQILTLTFSEAASGEMRERIRSTLQSWYRQEPHLLAHLKDAIDRIDEGYISTIHSFALRVIRESGLSLDLDPASGIAPKPLESAFWGEYARILDTVESERLASLLDGVWVERAREWMGGDLFLESLNHFSPETLQELAQSAGELFGSKGWDPERLWQWGDEQDNQTRERAFTLLQPLWDEAWEQWQAVFPQIADALNQDKGSTSNTVRAFFEAYSGGGDSLQARRDLFVAAVLEGLKTLPRAKELKTALEEALGVSAKEWRDARKKQAELTSLLCAPQLFDDQEQTVRRFLLQGAALGWQAWEGARRARSLLSFSDLIRYAGEALRSRDDSMGFRHLMVDEFQDTDSLQDALLQALWNKERNTLFIVGDLKQSIYRFRHANLRLFAGYIHRAMHGEGEDIRLNCSYRMNADLIREGNQLFTDLWPEGVCSGENIPYDPLLAPSDAPMWERRNPPGSPKLEALIAYPDPELKPAPKAEQKRKALYAVLAERFVALKEANTPIWDKRLKDPQTGESGAFRPASWGDFCVLTPARSAYAPLEEAFERHGIPAIFLANQSYYSRGEVLDLVSMLHTLENPKNQLALAGWIASPFSGVAPHTAVQLLETGHKEGGELHTLLQREHPDAWGRLNRLRRVAQLDAPSAALGCLLLEPQWLLSFSGDARRRAYANVRRGVQIVREYENSMGRSLAGCADYLARELRESAVQEEPDIFDADADVVRVMTMHASKGLEFPIVALAGLEQQIQRSPRSRSSASLHCGVTISSLPDSLITAEKSSGGTLSSALHAFLEKQEELEERQRLFYVAMTRAQERLLLCGTAHEKEGEITASGTLLEWFLNSSVYEEKRVRKIPVGETPLSAGAPTAQEEKSRIRVLTLPIPQAPSLARLSASAFALLRWCPRAYRLRYRQGRDLVWELPDGDGSGGADLGSLAHAILERWNFEPRGLDYWLPESPDEALLENRKRTLPSFLRAEYHSGRSRALLREWLLAFAATSQAEVLREQLAGGGLKREIPFRARSGDTLFVGSIDLCWQQEGLCIRDWKITPEQRAPHELYESQLLFYGGACHLMLPGKVREIGLIYLRPDSDGLSLISTADRDWDEVVNDMKKAAQEATGDLPPTLSRCERCPWKRSCGVFDEVTE